MKGCPATVHRTQPGVRAFSLIELLTVMAIIVVLASFVLPAVNSIVMGSKLSRAGQQVGDQFTLARQEAVGKNSDIEVRFFTLTNNGVVGVQGIQLWRRSEGPTGPVTNALSRLQILPEGVVVSTNSSLSPLLTAGGLTGSAPLPSRGNVHYQAFRIRANGATDPGVSTLNNFITLQNSKKTGDTNGNYYTIQIHPLTGRIAVYRP